MLTIGRGWHAVVKLVSHFGLASFYGQRLILVSDLQRTVLLAVINVLH